jgi:hypothetical protein
MRKTLFGALLAPACVLAIGSTVPARALVVAPPPGPQQVGQADTVIVGRVMAIEDKDVAASPVKGSPQKANYRVAVVRVGENIKGAEGKEMIRVAWIAPQAPQPGNPNVPQVRPIRPGFRGGIALNVGQDGMFYLKKHHEQKFYTMVNPFGSFIPSENNPNFNQEVEKARKTVKLLAEPVKGLKSANAEDRLLAAGLLITRYRTQEGPRVKTEAIPAEESKLILKVLADADWNPQGGRFNQMNALNLFQQLGLTAKDGWNQPQPQPGQQNYLQVLNDAARTWLRENQNTYRIQRFVNEPTDR